LIDVNRRVVSRPEFRREAERLLEEHGEAFGGDGRVAAGGQSSGANLVAAACLMARDRAAHA
jgi:acetyl esterase/lipase